jgi:hypothetical protein
MRIGPYLLVNYVTCIDRQGRLDFEGPILANAIRRLESQGISKKHRSRIVNDLSRTEGVDGSCVGAILDTFLPGERHPSIPFMDAVSELSTRITEAALAGSPFCLAWVGILQSIGFPVGPEVIQFSASNRDNSFGDEHFLSSHHLIYSVADSMGSTMGTLSHLELVARSGDLESVCEGFVDVLGVLAEQSLTEDIFEDWISPGLLDVSRKRAPLLFLSTSSIEADEERLGFVVRSMRKNAEILESSLFLSPTEILEMMGVDEDPQNDTILEDMESFSSLSDHDIAEEIVQAIRTDMFNVNAIHYNNALTKSSSPEACSQSVYAFRDLTQNCNLLIKTMFHLLQITFYKFEDTRMSFILSLLLGALGVKSGYLNAISLLGYDPTLVNSLDSFEAIAYTNIPAGVGCTGQPSAAIAVQDMSHCMSVCDSDSTCRFIAFDSANHVCEAFSMCDFKIGKSPSKEFFEKSHGPGWFPCLQRSSSDVCVRFLWESLAISHGHVESINNLVRMHQLRGELDLALKWAMFSFERRSYEGMFYLARLEGIEWDNHRANRRKAKAIYWEMLMAAGKGEPPKTTSREELNVLEHEAIREIALQLGIPDYSPAQSDAHDEPSPWPRRLAALSGLLITYYEENKMRLGKVATTACLIPVLFFLLHRRAVIVA